MPDKPRKDKGDTEKPRDYASKPRIDKPNTPGGHSDKVRQTIQGENRG